MSDEAKGLVSEPRDGSAFNVSTDGMIHDCALVFEGGGYEAKGMFSPHMDCLMKTFKGNEFCPVCQRAIERMILYYSE